MRSLRLRESTSGAPPSARREFSLARISAGRVTGPAQDRLPAGRARKAPGRPPPSSSNDRELSLVPYFWACNTRRAGRHTFSSRNPGPEHVAHSDRLQARLSPVAPASLGASQWRSSGTYTRFPPSTAPDRIPLERTPDDVIREETRSEPSAVRSARAVRRDRT